MYISLAFMKNLTTNILVDLYSNAHDLYRDIAEYSPSHIITERYIPGHQTINPKEYLYSSEYLPTENEASIRLENEITKLKLCFKKDHYLSIRASVILLHEHSLRSTRSYIYAVKKVINQYSTLCLLIPWSASSCNVYLYESEGETQLDGDHLFYSKGDFLYALLVKYCNLNEIQYRTISQPLFPAIEMAQYLFRRIGRIYARLLFHNLKLAYALTTKRKIKASNAIENSDHCNLFVSRSPVHSEYLKNILTKISSPALLLDTVPLNRSKTNILFCQDLKIPLFDLSHHITIKDFLSSFIIGKTICKALFKSNKDSLKLSQDYWGSLISIDLTQYICEAYVLAWEAQLLQKRIERCIKSINRPIKTISHCEMFSQYPNYFYALKNRLNSDAKVNILSFGTYELPPLPNTIQADRLYSFNVKQRCDLLKFNSASNPVYSGNSFLDKTISRITSSSLVFFYSQPYQTDQELELITHLSNIYPNTLVYIEHPRTNYSFTSSLRYALPSLQIVSSRSYFLERARFDRLMKIAITRTSNVGYRLILQGVPVVYVQDLPQGFSVTLDFFDNYPLIAENWRRVIEIIDSERSIHEFFKFRKTYIDNVYNYLDSHDLANSIAN